MYLKNVEEQELGNFRTAPEGKYLFECIAATATISDKQNPMITTIWQIVDDAEFSGVEAREYFLTTDVKGAGFSKKKLAALLGDAVVNSEVEIPDEQLAERLLGMRAEAETVLEAVEKYVDKNNKKAGTVPATRMDAQGNTVQTMANKIRSFYAPAGQTQAAPIQQAPQAPQYAAPPQQAQQFVQPQQPQFVQPQAPQGFAPPGYAPPGYAPPTGQYAQPLPGQQIQGQQQQLAPNGGYALPPGAPQQWAGMQQPQQLQAAPGGQVAAPTTRRTKKG